MTQDRSEMPGRGKLRMSGAEMEAGFHLGAALAREVARALYAAQTKQQQQEAAESGDDVDLADLLDAIGGDAQGHDDPSGTTTKAPGTHILDLIDVHRLCRLFSTPADLSGLAEQGSHTEVIVGPEDDPAHVSPLLAKVLREMNELTRHVFGLTRVEIVHSGRLEERRRSSRARADARDLLALRLTRSLQAGRAAIAVMPIGLDPDPRAVASRRARLVLPPVTAEILADVLQLLFPGDVAPAGLPDDADLAGLDTSLLLAALAADNAAEAAARLHRYTGRLRSTGGPHLSDMALAPEVRALLDRMVREVAGWKAGQLDWAQTTHSALLWGAPGTGKTMLAGALASTMGVPLISTSYAQCQAAGHLGDYLGAMHAAVNEAIARAPTVFFLDEFDSFGERDARQSNARYNRHVVNDMLAQLTRLHETPGVVVLAATNTPSLIDSALRRAGRFDLKLEIGLPDLAGLRAILKTHLGAAAPDAPALIEAARALVGQSGATAAAVAREAMGLARDDGTPVDPAHLAAATARHAPVMLPGDLWRMAVHEAGHVLLAAARGLPLPERVTIGATGGTAEMRVPQFLTAEATLDWTAALLGGRAAEQILCGAPSSAAGAGPGSDLDLATGLLVRLEFEWGLGDCGLMHTPVPPDRRAWLPDGPRHKVSVLLHEAEDIALDALIKGRAYLTGIAEALVDARALDRAALEALLEGYDPTPPPERGPEPDLQGRTVIPLR